MFLCPFPCRSFASRIVQVNSEEISKKITHFLTVEKLILHLIYLYSMYYVYFYVQTFLVFRMLYYCF